MSSKYSARLLAASMSASALILTAGGAYAEDVAQLEKLNVSAFVGDACTVTAADLAFGEYNPSLESQQQGTIEIDCVTATALGIKLNGGLNGNNGNNRTMKNGTSDLAYLLFTENFNVTPWTDTLQNDVSVQSGTSNVAVFGTIPAGTTSLVDGLYSDEVTITLVF